MAFTHYQRITRHASGRITRDAWTPLQRTQSIDGAIWGETRVTHVSDEVVWNQGFAEALGRVEYRGSDGLVTDLGEVFLRTIAHWVCTHDTGVQPAGEAVQGASGWSVRISGTEVTAAGVVNTVRREAYTYADARVILGY